MNVLSSLRMYFFKRRLRKLPPQKKLNGRVNPAKRIAIFYTLSTREEISTIEVFYTWLMEQGRAVEVILYSQKIPEFEIPDDFILLVPEDINRYFIPKEKVLQALPRMEFDLVINLNRAEHLPLHYLSAACRSDLKVGFYETRAKLFDVLIDTKPKGLEGDISLVKETIRQISV